MVSLRRRRLLGYSQGVNINATAVQPPKNDEDAVAATCLIQNVNSANVHPVLSDDIIEKRQEQNVNSASERPIISDDFTEKRQEQDISSAIAHPIHSDDFVEKRQEQDVSSAIEHPLNSDDFLEKRQEQVKSNEAVPEVSNMSSSGLSEEEPIQQYRVLDVKRRRSYKRKHTDSKEPFMLKGVYYKNKKWQAAIKVDKIQVHLGTLESQEEAALLYDRAAFLQGRGTNFELQEEEKKALKQLKWEGFLEMIRKSIMNNKHRRKFSATCTDF